MRFEQLNDFRKYLTGSVGWSAATTPHAMPNIIRWGFGHHVCLCKLSPLILGAAMLTGCVTAPVRGHADLLDFLKDGQTTKQEVLLKLTSSCGQYDHGKILTYRLGFAPGNHGYYLSENPTWDGVTYSLVLVFDEAGVLNSHSLVKVR
jgi:hypothetical protein